MIDQSGKDKANLEGFDAAKRQTLTRLVTTAAFVVPVVASFSIDALTISSALAQVSNGGNGGDATSS